MFNPTHMLAEQLHATRLNVKIPKAQIVPLNHLVQNFAENMTLNELSEVQICITTTIT